MFCLSFLFLSYTEPEGTQSEPLPIVCAVRIVYKLCSFEVETSVIIKIPLVGENIDNIGNKHVMTPKRHYFLNSAFYRYR